LIHRENANSIYLISSRALKGVEDVKLILTNNVYRDMATNSVSDRVRELAQHLDTNESEVIQQAVEAGVETLYRDMVISQYLDGEITREEAMDELGVDVVEEVDSARDAIEEDVEWGLNA
jgi:hypothetical protein